jgi:lipooligosaccharide transport system permease protein
MNRISLTLSLAWQVVVRNWVVYRKDFIANVSPTLADPALVLMSLGVGLSPFIGRIEGLAYAQFLAPGMVASTALFTAFFECSSGFYVRLPFHSVFYARQSAYWEVVIEKPFYIRSALMASGVGVVVLVFGLLLNPSCLVLFSFIGGLLGVPCGGIGLLASCWVRNINQFQSVYSFLIAPIYFLSGVFFPLTGHNWLAFVVQLSPFYHGVRLLQLAAWGQWRPHEVLLHVAVLVLFAAGFGWLALAQVRRKLIL